MPTYAGINGVVRKLKEWPVGVNGVVHQQKEVWAGVDGVNRKIFSKEKTVKLTMYNSYTSDIKVEAHYNGSVYTNGTKINIPVSGQLEIRGYIINSNLRYPSLTMYVNGNRQGSVSNIYGYTKCILTVTKNVTVRTTLVSSDMWRIDVTG